MTPICLVATYREHPVSDGVYRKRFTPPRGAEYVRKIYPNVAYLFAGEHEVSVVQKDIQAGRATLLELTHEQAATVYADCVDRACERFVESLDEKLAELADSAVNQFCQNSVRSEST